jgi:hypothetical protein
VIDATGNAGTHAFIVVDGSNTVHIANRDEVSRVLMIAAGAP